MKTRLYRVTIVQRRAKRGQDYAKCRPIERRSSNALAAHFQSVIQQLNEVHAVTRACLIIASCPIGDHRKYKE